MALPRTWLLVRTGPLGPEEEGVLAALATQLAREGIQVRTVLLGTASYEAERAPEDLPAGTGAAWLLEEDVAGRGVRSRSTPPVRRITFDELVEALMAAERVLSLT